MKDLSLFQKYIKNQKVSYNFRLGFALSNRPHLHRAYVVPVYNQNFIAVLDWFYNKEDTIIRNILFGRNLELIQYSVMKFNDHRR